VWQVTGRSNGIAESGFGRNMAAYRAAELLKAAGFSHMQIIDQKGRANFIGIGGGPATSSAGEFLTLTVRGANDPAPPSECRAKRPDQCFTLAVDPLMAACALPSTSTIRRSDGRVAGVKAGVPGPYAPSLDIA
jgi:hypothetical protein